MQAIDVTEICVKRLFSL